MILVSIIGDFYSSVLPIFYNFKDDIKEHIIVYDDAKQDEHIAKNILNGTTSFIVKNDLNIKNTLICIDEDTFLKDIQNFFEVKISKNNPVDLYNESKELRYVLNDQEFKALRKNFWNQFGHNYNTKVIEELVEKDSFHYTPKHIREMLAELKQYDKKFMEIINLLYRYNKKIITYNEHILLVKLINKNLTRWEKNFR